MQQLLEGFSDGAGFLIVAAVLERSLLWRCEAEVRVRVWLCV